MKYCIVSVMIICSSILWVSCTDRALETSLKLSGENRAELERVLLHYKDNPEKKKAAEFLIRNMKWCHGKDSPFMDIYYKQVDSLQANDSIYAEEVIAFYDSIYKPERFQNMTVTFDLRTIKADYLIDHIDTGLFRHGSRPGQKHCHWMTFVNIFFRIVWAMNHWSRGWPCIRKHSSL